MLALDTSASMHYPPTGVSKFRYGQILTAALAYLASEQGHAVGLMTMTDDQLSYLAGARRTAASALAARPHRQTLAAGGLGSGRA